MEQLNSEMHSVPLRNHPTTVGMKIDYSRRTRSRAELPSSALRDCVLERPGYSIRVAHTSDQRSAASALIARRYSWRGYQTETAAALPHNTKHITLEASSTEQVFGTITLKLNSGEGLCADVLYATEINEFRKMNRRVCEISKLAVDPQYGSKEVLASLFQLAYIYARVIHQATDVFIEVNPRHAGFYKRMLGFHQIGELRTCPRVNAPAVLLHLDLEYMGAQISLHGGTGGDATQRSLYSYFLSQSEQERVTRGICSARTLN